MTGPATTTLTPDTDDSWRKRAACRSGQAAPPDPELFHPVGVSAEALAQADEALSWCARCPLTAVQGCLAFGLENKATGIWGGRRLDDGKPTIGDPHVKVKRCMDCRGIVDRPKQYVRCKACRASTADSSRAPADCGTRRGAGRHWRRGEKACPACCAANRAYRASRRSRATGQQQKAAA